MIDQFTLQNGLRVIGEPIGYFRSVSVGLWLGVGSQYETSAQAGVSHFIEHMLFKGTKRYSAREIAQVMDAVGGQLNAFTAKECTCFYCKVVDENLKLALDVLSDLVRHSTFLPEEFKKEKGVVLEEIAMAEDAPEDVVSELSMLAQYGDQPLARPILGTNASVSALNRRDVLAYYRHMYRPENCVLAIAGNYQLDEMRALAQEYLGDWENPKDALPEFRTVPAAPGILRREKEIEQLHLCVNWPGAEQGSDMLYPMSVVNSVFGGAMSSRLFQKIREEMGMAYSVYSYPSVYRDTGMLSVYAGTSMDNGVRVMEEILREAETLAEQGMTLTEFEQARAQLRAGYIMGQESASSRMNALGRRLLLLNEVQTEEDVIDKISKIDYHTTNDYAREILRSRPSFALVGHHVEQVEVPDGQVAGNIPSPAGV